MSTSTERSLSDPIQSQDRQDQAEQSQTQPAKCPNCAAPYRPGELACPSCGLVFFNVARTRQIQQPFPEEHTRTGRVGEAFVQRPKPLALVIHGQIIDLLTQDDLLLGRASPLPGDIQPDIDLTACGAEELGVSRPHI